MYKIAFAGFGGVNTPREIISKLCASAEKLLTEGGLDLCSVYPITGGDAETSEAIAALAASEPSALVLCVAGWISPYEVIKVAERFRHLPVALWGLSGWYENDRLITTAGQAGAAALRQTLCELGYTFRYVHDVAGRPPKAAQVVEYCHAACAAQTLRHSKAGMMGYRDMNLYGTMFDGASLKRVVGVEIESFEMLDMMQRYADIPAVRKQEVIDNNIGGWRFRLPSDPMTLMKTAGYYLAVSDIAKERGYGAVSLKDADGMKALLGFPPAPILMLLADIDGLSVVPENDSLGCVTQMMIKAITGQCGAYLRLYEFLESSVLAGAPDFIPAEITEGDTRVLPSTFGSQPHGLLNVSDIRTGRITLCRLVCTNGKYRMHLLTGRAKSPGMWEESGWSKPIPQLPAIEIELSDVEDFASKVSSHHYFISYGDNVSSIAALCDILGIEVY